MNSSNKTVIRNERVVNGAIFRDKCPTAKKILENAIRVYKILLRIGDGIKAQHCAEAIRFSASVEQIMTMHNEVYKMATDKDTIHRYINALAYMGLIRKLDMDDLNDEEYEALSTYEKAKGNPVYRHIQYYSIPYLYNENLLNIEANAQRWKEHNYSIRAFGYELLYRTEGYDVAAKIFPRYKDYWNTTSSTNTKVARSTTTESDERTFKIIDFIMKNINEHGYCLYKDILSELKLHDRLVNKSLPSILQDYGLKRVFLNNQLKESLDIHLDGHPSLLIPEAIYLGTEK